MKKLLFLIVPIAALLIGTAVAQAQEKVPLKHVTITDYKVDDGFGNLIDVGFTVTVAGRCTDKGCTLDRVINIDCRHDRFKARPKLDGLATALDHQYDQFSDPADGDGLVDDFAADLQGAIVRPTLWDACAPDRRVIVK